MSNELQGSPVGNYTPSGLRLIKERSSQPGVYHWYIGAPVNIQNTVFFPCTPRFITEEYLRAYLAELTGAAEKPIHLIA